MTSSAFPNLAMLRMMDQAQAESIMAGRAPDQIISRGDDPFFERWWLLRKGPGDIENIYLHRFFRSDREDMHDHPWDNVSLVVCGSYREATPAGTHLRRRGDIVFRRAEERHAIVSVAPGTISLFVTGAKYREWGFWTPEGFVHHLDYRPAAG